MKKEWGEEDKRRGRQDKGWGAQEEGLEKLLWVQAKSQVTINRTDSNTVF